jgi:hypothetical protein
MVFNAVAQPILIPVPALANVIRAVESDIGDSALIRGVVKVDMEAIVKLIDHDTMLWSIKFALRLGISGIDDQMLISAI